ncbi:hypothetical protein T11_4115 [Trichinella zimbabwensis]|uniref:Uncharacterized protein n=1 Tax=Trichinella zimbabwensis TaxID=268475 RepID=A0A0V1I0M7_9BILA|nr:hypothetical protein T11_4115 [Trichinella zimbabwensis]
MDRYLKTGSMTPLFKCKDSELAIWKVWKCLDFQASNACSNSKKDLKRRPTWKPEICLPDMRLIPSCLLDGRRLSTTSMMAAWDNKIDLSSEIERDCTVDWPDSERKGGAANGRLAYGSTGSAIPDACSRLVN